MTQTPTQPSALADEVIPAKGRWAREIKRGEVLRITDIEGQQAIDFICYRLDDLAEKFWAAHSAKLNGTIYVSRACSGLILPITETHSVSTMSIVVRAPTRLMSCGPVKRKRRRAAWRTSLKRLTRAPALTRRPFLVSANSARDDQESPVSPRTASA